MSTQILHSFRVFCFALLLLDLLFEVWTKGILSTCYFRFKYVSSWALSLSLLYFYWVISFELFQPKTRKKYSSFLLNLQALNISLYSLVIVNYWLFLHDSSTIERVGSSWGFWFRFLFLYIFIVLDFLFNDIPIKLGSRKFIFPTILTYLLVNLYFTISQGVAVYSIISWTDWKTPLVFLECVVGMYAVFYGWFSVSKRSRNKLKCD